jgi:hypothetical protein
MVGYLEDYVEAVEKVHGRQAKEYEKVLKVSQAPESFFFLAHAVACDFRIVLLTC